MWMIVNKFLGSNFQTRMNGTLRGFVASSQLVIPSHRHLFTPLIGAPYGPFLFPNSTYHFYHVPRGRDKSTQSLGGVNNVPFVKPFLKVIYYKHGKYRSLIWWVCGGGVMVGTYWGSILNILFSVMWYFMSLWYLL